MTAIAIIYGIIAVGMFIALVVNMALKWNDFTKGFSLPELAGLTIATSLFWLPVLILIITANGKFRD